MNSRILRVVARALCLTSLALPALSQVPGFCPGDGSLIACPCGNDGAAGRGCANSVFAIGALLTESGDAHVSIDTVVLTASSLTGGWGIFFQGDAAVPPVLLDDGLGCVTGNVIRLGTKSISGAASSYPSGADPLISIRGAIPPWGGLRYYQCFYRNADTAFCPPETSNRTNGVVLFWYGAA